MQQFKTRSWPKSCTVSWKCNSYIEQSVPTSTSFERRQSWIRGQRSGWGGGRGKGGGAQEGDGETEEQERTLMLRTEGGGRSCEAVLFIFCVTCKFMYFLLVVLLFSCWYRSFTLRAQQRRPYMPERPVTTSHWEQDTCRSKQQTCCKWDYNNFVLSMTPACQWTSVVHMCS